MPEKERKIQPCGRWWTYLTSSILCYTKYGSATISGSNNYFRESYYYSCPWATELRSPTWLIAEEILVELTKTAFARERFLFFQRHAVIGRSLCFRRARPRFNI